MGNGQVPVQRALGDRDRAYEEFSQASQETLLRKIDCVANATSFTLDGYGKRIVLWCGRRDLNSGSQAWKACTQVDCVLTRLDHAARQTF